MDNTRVIESRCGQLREPPPAPFACQSASARFWSQGDSRKDSGQILRPGREISRRAGTVILPRANAARERGIALPLLSRLTVIYALVAQVGHKPGLLDWIWELRRSERRTAEPTGLILHPARLSPISPLGATGRGVFSFSCFIGFPFKPLAD